MSTMRFGRFLAAATRSVWIGGHPKSLSKTVFRRLPTRFHFITRRHRGVPDDGFFGTDRH